MPLNPKQKRFVQEYLIDLNATQAAKRAGYSDHTAGQQGDRLLKNAKIAAAIQKAINGRSAKTEIKAERVLEELAKIAFSDMRVFSNWGPAGVEITESEKLSEDAARCVAEVSETITPNGRSVRFKLHNKIDALEKLGRHLGIFTEVDRKHDKEMREKTGADIQTLIDALPKTVYYEHPAVKHLNGASH